MALKIRLRKQGANNRQTFRLVVADIRSPRDGKYIEKLGWYIPFHEENNVSLNAERISYWLSQGAEISHQAQMLVAKAAPEIMKQYTEKLQAKRLKEVQERRALRKAATKK